MPVVSSTFTKSLPVQIDGSQWVVEEHLLSTGETFSVGYQCSGDIDAQSAMLARVPLINDMLVASELEEIFNGP